VYLRNARLKGSGSKEWKSELPPIHLAQRDISTPCHPPRFKAGLTCSIPRQLATDCLRFSRSTQCRTKVTSRRPGSAAAFLTVSWRARLRLGVQFAGSFYKNQQGCQSAIQPRPLVSDEGNELPVAPGVANAVDLSPRRGEGETR
jgi:hypothetical protein